jgi:hypothetical protein
MTNKYLTMEQFKLIPHWKELGPLKDTDDQEHELYWMFMGTYPIPLYRSKKNLKYSK